VFFEQLENPLGKRQARRLRSLFPARMQPMVTCFNDVVETGKTDAVFVQ